MDDFKAEPFIEQLKKKSCERINNYSQEPSNDKMDISKGLDLIQKLDIKLKEVEEKHKNASPSTTATFALCDPSSKQSSELAENYIRKKKSKDCRLTQMIERLDQNQPETCTGFMLRNIKLGPNSRYFMLKPEEEAIVERLLQQPDVENEARTSSFTQYDLGFEMSEEDAERLARIDDELLQYQRRQKYTSDLSVVSAPCTHDNILEVENGSITTTHSKQSRLCCKAAVAKDQMTDVGDYLIERRHCREYYLQSEAIDKKLKDLQVSELPHVTTEERTILLKQCIYEQGMGDTLASC